MYYQGIKGMEFLPQYLSLKVGAYGCSCKFGSARVEKRGENREM